MNGFPLTTCSPLLAISTFFPCGDEGVFALQCPPTLAVALRRSSLPLFALPPCYLATSLSHYLTHPYATKLDTKNQRTVQGSVYFNALPPNMLGTFIIALVGTSAMVQLDEKKAVAILPSDHPWQDNGPLQVGVRTGLCGSITTFSSWLLAAMETCLDGNQWLTGIGQIVVGIACAVVSYEFGIQCALLVHHRLYREKGGPGMEDKMLDFEKERADYVFGRVSEELRPGRLSAEVERVGVDLPRQEPLGSRELRPEDFSGEYSGVVSGDGVDAKGMREALKTRWGARPKALITRTARVGLVCLVLLTVGSCFGVAYETRHEWIRQIWLAVLFAPFGCTGRWVLSMLNYKMKAEGLKWVPVGTLAANWTGVVVDYALAAVTLRAGLGYWASLVIGAIEDGFCGSLTTVSTLMAELVTFAALLPFSLRAYVYGIVTFLGAFLLGLAVLGWAYWA